MSINGKCRKKIMDSLKKTVKIFALILLAAVFLPGCSLKEAAENRTNLEKIKVGMTQAQVKEIMGEPLKEVYSAPDIWFYYTKYQWFDGMNTRDECTPLMFNAEGILIGIGYDFYKEELDKNPMNRRRLDIQL